jgi:hypothetical protein
MAASMPDRRVKAFRFALASLIVLAVMGGLEAGVRLAGLSPPTPLFTVSAADFDRVPGIFDPGQVVRLQAGTPFEHTVTIDSLGYRGGHFPRVRPAGEMRVLFAGDSFTFGHNVEDHETLPAQVEGELRRRCSGDALAINAGLSGSTILAQAELIRRGLELNPLAAVLTYHENDLEELAHVRTWDQLARNRRIKSAFPLSLVYRVARHSSLGAIGLQARVGHRLRRHTLKRAEEAQDTSWIEPARVEYRDRLQSVADRVVRHGTHLVFVTFPHSASVANRQGGRDYDWVVQTARDAGLPTVDLLQEFLDAGVVVDSMFLVPDDYHPSPAGYAFAAVRIADQLGCVSEEAP